MACTARPGSLMDGESALSAISTSACRAAAGLTVGLCVSPKIRHVIN